MPASGAVGNARLPSRYSAGFPTPGRPTDGQEARTALLRFEDSRTGHYILRACDAWRPSDGRTGLRGHLTGMAYGRGRDSEARVIIGGRTWPKDRRWIIAITIATLATAAAYVAEWSAEGRMPGGSSRTGLVAGIAGGLIIVFELLLWPRKRVRSWRLGSAQSWLRAHIWLGVLALPLVLMHARLLFIGGLLNWALMTLFLLVIASGVWGLVMQQYLPRTLLEDVPAETIHDQIDHVARQQCHETEKLVDALCERDPLHGHADHAETGAADDTADDDEHAVVTGFRSMTGIQGKVVETLAIYAAIPGTLPIRRSFFAEIRPYLLDGRAAGAALAQPQAAARMFAKLRSVSPAAAADLIDRLEQACERRRQFDLQKRLHWWLHAWLLVHVPLSVALGVLLAIHVPVALWYW
jgi:hypothetical protein